MSDTVAGLQLDFTDVQRDMIDPFLETAIRDEVNGGIPYTEVRIVYGNIQLEMTFAELLRRVLGEVAPNA